jgi:hypothetical protein
MTWKYSLIALTLAAHAVQMARAHTHSPIGKEAIYILVIVEVAVAFSIGILCIIFSCNLLRAVTDSDPSNLTSGQLPRSRSGTSVRRHSRTLSSVHRSRGDLAKDQSSATAVNGQTLLYEAVSSGNNLDYDLEYETESVDNINRNSFAAIIRAFTDYLRLW